MAERYETETGGSMDPRLEERLETLNRDLEIMERHSMDLDAVEGNIQEDLRKWDREYKDAHLHSVPRPRKHLR